MGASHARSARPAPRPATPRGRGRRGCGGVARARRSRAPAAGSASPRSPYSIWIALRMPRSPPERTSGRSRWKIRNISAVHWPRPRTATISSIASSSASSSRRSSSSSPLITCAARSRMYSTLRPERPAPRRSSSLGLQQLLGRGRRAAEDVEHPQVDRPRRFGRELLADDRPQQRPVGVGRALLAAPLQPRRQVDLADPLDQRRHHRVGGGERFARLGAHRPCPVAACASRRRRGCPRGSPRRRSRTRAGRSGPPPARR